MSHWCYNVTLKGVGQEDVAEYLKQTGDTAFVAPTVNDCTVLSCKDCDYNNYLFELAQTLSSHFGCYSLGYSNWDNSNTEYKLFGSGTPLDFYRSNSDQNVMLSVPEGGDAALLCQAFEAEANEKQVEATLQGRIFYGDEEDEDTFPDDKQERDEFIADGGLLFNEEMERHKSLAHLLNLPNFVTTFEYDDVADAVEQEYSLDDDLDMTQMVHVP